MTIQLKDGVYWDTEADRQSAEAYAWMREENFSRLGMSPTDENMHIPEMDKYKRPVCPKSLPICLSFLHISVFHRTFATVPAIGTL